MASGKAVIPNADELFSLVPIFGTQTVMQTYGALIRQRFRKFKLRQSQEGHEREMGPAKILLKRAGEFHEEMEWLLDSDACELYLEETAKTLLTGLSGTKCSSIKAMEAIKKHLATVLTKWFYLHSCLTVTRWKRT